MSETSKQKNHQWLEMGPVLIFFVVYMWLQRQDNEQALYIAAVVLAVLSVAALLWIWLKHKTVSFLLIFSTVVVCGSAGIAYFTDNKDFIYHKPTFMNALFGVAVIGGVFLKKNVIQMLLGSAFEMPQKAWNVLAIRWGLFFFVLAGLNAYVAETQTEAFWVSFKTFGLMPLTLLFTFSQIPFILKYGTIKEQD